MPSTVCSWPTRTNPNRRPPQPAAAGCGARKPPASSTGGPNTTAIATADNGRNRRHCPGACLLAGSKLCEGHREFIAWAEEQAARTPEHAAALEAEIVDSELELLSLNCPFDPGSKGDSKSTPDRGTQLRSAFFIE